MKHLTWTICLVCLLAVQALAQSTAPSTLAPSNDAEKEAVKNVIKQTFRAMITVDTVLLKSCFAPDAMLQVIQNQKDSVVVRTSKVSDFVASIGKQQAGALDERSFD